jgi:hypothetical protein
MRPQPTLSVGDTAMTMPAMTQRVERYGLQ